jgi:hypothetical protein
MRKMAKNTDNKIDPRSSVRTTSGEWGRDPDPAGSAAGNDQVGTPEPGPGQENRPDWKV